MGIIRDGIGQALGANQVNTGFNGPKLPFTNNSSSTNTRPSPLPRQPRRLPPRPDYQSYSNGQDTFQHDRLSAPISAVPPPYRDTHGGYADRTQYYRQDNEYIYNRGSEYDQSYPRTSEDDHLRSFYSSPGGTQSMRRTGLNSGFRPLCLPQTEHGDGKPFLRGYSDELRQYGIEEQDFIHALDLINVAIIPNPENQIFQKAANIAGYFVPGSAGLGLIAGQFVVGIGSAFGHVSMVNKRLSEANLKTFIPKGLEICLGHGKDVNNETGISPESRGYQGSTDPEERLAQYGDAVMPLSVVYPVQQGVGRRDPIAMLGRGIGSRDNGRKIKKAEKERTKGKKSKKGDSLEGGLKWLMVRQTTPESMAQWQKTLEQSDAALAQEQAQAERSGAYR